jgi:hypothetical protein
MKLLPLTWLLIKLFILFQVGKAVIGWAFPNINWVELLRQYQLDLNFLTSENVLLIIFFLLVAKVLFLNGTRDNKSTLFVKQYGVDNEGRPTYGIYKKVFFDLSEPMNFGNCSFSGKSIDGSPFTNRWFDSKEKAEEVLERLIKNY